MVFEGVKPYLHEERITQVMFLQQWIYEDYAERTDNVFWSKFQIAKLKRC